MGSLIHRGVLRKKEQGELSISFLWLVEKGRWMDRQMDWRGIRDYCKMPGAGGDMCVCMYF